MAQGAPRKRTKAVARSVGTAVAPPKSDDHNASSTVASIRAGRTGRPVQPALPHVPDPVPRRDANDGSAALMNYRFVYFLSFPLCSLRTGFNCETLETQ